MKEQSKPNLIQMNFVLWICHSKNMSLVTGSAADYNSNTNNDDTTSLMVDKSTSYIVFFIPWKGD